MDWIIGSVPILFILATLYVLARAMDWGRGGATLIAVGTLFVPIGVLAVSFAGPIAPLRPVLEVIAILTPPIVLFAMAKTVSNRVVGRAA